MTVDRNHRDRGQRFSRMPFFWSFILQGLVAFRTIVVDGVGENAKRFYEHFGFIQIKAMDMKLILSTADILKSSLEACDGRDCYR